MTSKNLKSRTFYNWIIFIIGFYFLLGGIVRFIVFLLPEIGAKYRNHINLMLDEPIVDIIISTLIIAPILEELIFRKFLMWFINKFTKKFFLINVIQAFLFALSHINPIHIIYTFVLGLILGKSKKEFGTLWAPIILHSIYNIFGVSSSFVIKEIFKKINIPLDDRTIYSIIILIYLTLGSLIVYKMNKKINLIK